MNLTKQSLSYRGPLIWNEIPPPIFFLVWGRWTGAGRSTKWLDMFPSARKSVKPYPVCAFLSGIDQCRFGGGLI